MVSVRPGLDAEALCQTIATSKRLVLHAALYSNFALEPFQGAFVDALSKAEFKRLDIITPDRASTWMSEFDRILRQDWTTEQMEQAWQQSDLWCQHMRELNPERVGVHRSVAMPCNPILLLDQQLLIGQYAHSSAMAPQGLWMQIDLHSAETSLEQLWHWAENGVPNEGVTDWQLAAFRHVAECHHAIRASK